MSIKVAVILNRPSLASSIQRDQASTSLVKNLGLKPKSAQQILSNAPLKVYKGLAFDEGKLIVSLLNLITPLQWAIKVDMETDLPSVSWNKKPRIMGMSLKKIIEKNDPCKTGIQEVAGVIARGKVKDSPPSERSQSEPKGPITHTHDSAILEFNDQSIIRDLSNDLEEVVKTRNIPLDPEVSLPGYAIDSQNVPGVSESDLEPGFYNLYLPHIKAKELALVSQLCEEALGWSKGETERQLSKPMVCIAQDIDDIDASRLVERFAQVQIKLNCKLRSKI